MPTEPEKHGFVCESGSSQGQRRVQASHVGCLKRQHKHCWDELGREERGGFSKSLSPKTGHSNERKDIGGRSRSRGLWGRQRPGPDGAVEPARSWFPSSPSALGPQGGWAWTFRKP